MRTHPQKRRGSAAPDPARRVLVESTAVASLLPALSPDELPTRRDLLLQALLHLPRLARADGSVDVESAQIEIARLRQQRAVELEPLRAFASPPPEALAIDQLEVGIVERERAEPVLAHFHYLRSFRSDSVNVALLDRERIVALCSISPFDLATIGERLPIRTSAEVAVVSRVFAFDWAPRNVISYLLARAEHSPAVDREVRLLLTYLNPNLGFTGASYRAANWRKVGLEAGTRYAYLNGNYITDRRLPTLSSADRAEIEYSTMLLEPLQIYGRSLDRRLAKDDELRASFLVGREPTVER